MRIARVSACLCGAPTKNLGITFGAKKKEKEKKRKKKKKKNKKKKIVEVPKMLHIIRGVGRCDAMRCDAMRWLPTRAWHPSLFFSSLYFATRRAPSANNGPK